MIRLVGMLVGLGFTFVVLLAFGNGAYVAMTEGLGDETAEHAFHKEAKHVSFQHDGIFGTWDVAQLQRGYQVYKEVCASCHSMDQIAYRNLTELGYSEEQVKAEAATAMVPGINPDTGESELRAGRPTDKFPAPYANDVMAAASNGNAIPPDLSLMTKARHGGAAYVYSILTGYQAPDAELAERFPDSVPGPGLSHNPYFANLNLAMAPPLVADGQVTYAEGQPEPTIDQMAQDVSSFLTWTAEPTLVKRRQTGFPVLGFLLFATLLAWLSKKQIWAELKPKKRKEED